MKVLALPYTHTLSHLSRVLEIAKELRDRGHSVIFAGDRPKSPKCRFIEEEGFEVEEFYEPDPSTLFGNIRAGRLRFVERAVLETMIEEDRRVISAGRPDAVLSDGRFSAPVSCQLEGVFHAAIVNVSSTEYRASPYIPLFGPLSERFPLRRLNLWLEMFVFDHVMRDFLLLTKRHRLKKRVTATNCLTGVNLTLLADLPEYFPSEYPPPDYHYIGPLTFRKTGGIPLPNWRGKLEKAQRPIIYVTMGTTGIPMLFENVLSGLKPLSGTVVITTGEQIGGLEGFAGNVYVEAYLDGDEIMKKADCVVCHGGNGTIYQAVRNSCPILGIPTIPDQAFNMRRVEALGIGKSVKVEELSKRPEVLSDMVTKVTTSPSFRDSLQRLQAILMTYDGSRMGADLIEEMVKKRM